ncbi:MAG: methyltransferase domain-containing protein [Chloroflexi bacterium]|nr:methyltransferase domain-containing protein [Chloroflexota bacterium]
MSAHTEAEIQVLIAHLELAHPKETPNNNFYAFFPKTLDEAATYFRRFRVDWAAAYRSLLARGLLRRAGASYELTSEGVVAAARVRDARPPIYYWYEEFYGEAPYSPAFAMYCERLFGKALCQDGFADMEQVDLVFDVAPLEPGMRALDLGCGTGMIAEYLSDATGAQVTGIDYSPTAILQAVERTRSKADRLTFLTSNLDELERLPFPADHFDVITAFDSLYMPRDLDATLAQMCNLLAPDGRMVLYYTQMLFDPDAPRDLLAPERTPLGEALERALLPYSLQDFSAPCYGFLQLKRQIGEALREAFAAEGRSFLANHIVAESEGSTAPYDPETARLSRYVYVVEKS